MTDQAIPTVSELPLVGSLWGFLHHRLDLLERIAAECGDIGRARVVPSDIVLLNHPDDIQTLLVEYGYNGVKPRSIKAATQAITGQNLLTIEQEEHRKRRQLLAPHFQPRNITQLTSVITDSAERLQAQWKDGACIRLDTVIAQLILEIIGKILFGTDPGQGVPQIVGALHDIEKLVSTYVGLPLRIPLTWPTPQNQRHQRTLAVFHQFVDRMIAERRSSGTRHSDILDTLLHARDDTGHGLSDRQIRDEIMALFTNGNDTVRLALTWSWVLLMQHPDVMARLQTEIDTALSGRTPEHADLERMPYSLQVIKEALRLYPPYYIFVRKITAPITFRERYTVPSGHHCVISPYTLHRRPAWYPEPQRFDPDRFSPERPAPPRYAYLPFGAGPHTCLGQHIAMLEHQLALVTLAQRVSFELLPGQAIEPTPLVLLQPRGPIIVRVRRR